MPSNRIDAALTAEQRDKAKAALATLAETLPFLIDLTAEEHSSLPKFGEKNRSLRHQGSDHAYCRRRSMEALRPLSQGRAAKIADLCRAEFIEELFRSKVPACQVTAEELGEEWREN